MTYYAKRYVRVSSAIVAGNRRDKAAALITMAYHALEKGLALPKPWPGFGQDVARLLLWRLERYVKQFGHDEVTRAAIGAIEAWLRFQALHKLDIGEWVARRDAVLRLMSSGERGEGGAKEICREEFLQSARLDLRAFLFSRHSVREFEPRDVPIDLLLRAVALAQSAPSCCNRQPGRVWIVSHPERVSGVLQIQGGARGFAEQVPVVLVVTVDLSCWQSVGEWYQAWIDGALFAMTLVWSLHSLGLATCFLNWSKRKETDVALRQYLGVPDKEQIVVLVATGWAPVRFRVAVSPRLPLNKVVRFDTASGEYDKHGGTQAWR